MSVAGARAGLLESSCDGEILSCWEDDRSVGDESSVVGGRTRLTCVPVANSICVHDTFECANVVTSVGVGKCVRRSLEMDKLLSMYFRENGILPCT